MKNIKILLLTAVMSLTGCATQQYSEYLAANRDVAAKRSEADIERYKALSSIAAKGDTAASVAAAMALAMGVNTQQQQIIQAPQNEFLQWASVLVPALTQAYAIGKSADVAINASNNAAITSASTTAGFVNIASKIQAPTVPTPVVPQANIQTTNTTTLSGTGVLGSGRYSIDSHDIKSSYNPAPITTTNTSSYNPDNSTSSNTNSTSSPVIVGP